jgi:hypothetical protein
VTNNADAEINQKAQTCFQAIALATIEMAATITVSAKKRKGTIF